MKQVRANLRAFLECPSFKYVYLHFFGIVEIKQNIVFFIFNEYLVRAADILVHLVKLNSNLHKI